MYLSLSLYIYMWADKSIEEQHRAKVPKQVVRISWLNGEAAGCQDQVALDMVSFLAIQTSGKLAREPSHWIGSPSVAKPPTGWPAGQLVRWSMAKPILGPPGICRVLISPLRLNATFGPPGNRSQNKVDLSGQLGPVS